MDWDAVKRLAEIKAQSAQIRAFKQCCFDLKGRLPEYIFAGSPMRSFPTGSEAGSVAGFSILPP